MNKIKEIKKTLVTVGVSSRLQEEQTSAAIQGVGAAGIGGGGGQGAWRGRRGRGRAGGVPRRGREAAG